MGDMNACTSNWDNATNARDKRQRKQAIRHGWNAIGPETASCITTRGAGSPDTFVTKSIPISNEKTQTTKSITRSDHLPVQLMAQLHHSECTPREQRQIHRKQRRDLTITATAKEHYRTSQQRCQRKYGKHIVQINSKSVRGVYPNAGCLVFTYSETESWPIQNILDPNPARPVKIEEESIQTRNSHEFRNCLGVLPCSRQESQTLRQKQ